MCVDYYLVGLQLRISHRISSVQNENGARHILAIEERMKPNRTEPNKRPSTNSLEARNSYVSIRLMEYHRRSQRGEPPPSE